MLLSTIQSLQLCRLRTYTILSAYFLHHHFLALHEFSRRQTAGIWNGHSAFAGRENLLDRHALSLKFIIAPSAPLDYGAGLSLCGKFKL